MDVQVNVNCDPFSGDIYCSLFTGPVTEGDFFAARAPFNLLIPGWRHPPGAKSFLPRCGS